jgi:hypothetical protein
MPAVHMPRHGTGCSSSDKRQSDEGFIVITDCDTGDGDPACRDDGLRMGQIDSEIFARLHAIVHWQLRRFLTALPRIS